LAEEVIRPKEAIKGCFVTGCSAVFIFFLIALIYLVYLFYFDDSLDFD